MAGESLKKWMKKSGKNFDEGGAPQVLESAGQRKMKPKLKMEDKSGDELPVKPGDIARAVASNSKTGSLTKVKDDATGSKLHTPAEFEPVGKKKK